MFEVMEFRENALRISNGAGHVSGCCTSELIKRKLAGCGDFSVQCAINERTGNCVLKTSPFAVRQ